MKYLSLAIRFIVAIILLQTLYFKFTAHPDSVYIFSKVGLEPYGRIGIGILELIAAILLLIPRTVAWGALLSLGIISGAIFMHLNNLGIEVNDDNGLLFYLAVVVFVGSLITLILYRKQIPFFKG
ncbi:MAG: DoxX family protein [Chitinophagales bacterium]|nr:DoxX family protein [Bacteroidota bacterium]MCB9044019.1 DoxX family protein [Chitinophagales bacterium]